MKEHMTSVGYKPPMTKAIFVLLGVVLMGLVARMVLQFTWIGLLLTVIVGYAYWSMSRVLLQVRYRLDAEYLTIFLPNKKTLQIPTDTIQSWQKVEIEMPWWQARGVGVWNDKKYCLTAHDRLIQIVTDGGVYLISPRKWDAAVVDSFVR